MAPLFTPDLSDGFFTSLQTVCAALGCAPIDMLSVMKSESNVKASAHNPNGNASGLIQIMPANLPGLGWTTGDAAFRALSAEDQLPYVQKYFDPYKSKGLTSGARLYQATFLPATLDLGSDPNTVICQQGGINDFAYLPNKVFDENNDGKITVGELQDAIDRNTVGLRWQEIVARVNGTPFNPVFNLTTVEGHQGALAALGYLDGLGVDGINGPATKAAVMKFQTDQGLRADGVVGPNTIAAFGTALDAAGYAHTP